MSFNFYHHLQILMNNSRNFSSHLILGSLCFSSVFAVDYRIYSSNESSSTLSIVTLGETYNPLEADFPPSIDLAGRAEGVCVSPDFLRVYVASEGGVVNVIDAVTFEVLDVFQLIGSATSVRAIAITPDGNYLYVAARDPSTGLVIRVDVNDVTNQSIVLDPGSTFNDPYGIAISPDGATVYVSNSASNTISRISTVTNQVTGTFTVQTGPRGLAISSDGLYLYSANNTAKTISEIDLTNSNVFNSTAPSGNLGPFDISLSPDNNTVYMCSWSGSPHVNAYVYRWPTRNISGSGIAGPTMSTANRCRGVVASPDGQQVILSNYGDSTDGPSAGRALFVLPNNFTNSSIPTEIRLGDSNYIKPQFLELAQAPDVTFVVDYRAKSNQFIGQKEFFIILNWTEPEENITPTEFEIYRGANRQTLLARIPNTSINEYVDHNLKASTDYIYTIVPLYQGIEIGSRTITARTLNN